MYQLFKGVFIINLGDKNTRELKNSSNNILKVLGSKTLKVCVMLVHTNEKGKARQDTGGWHEG